MKTNKRKLLTLTALFYLIIILGGCSYASGSHSYGETVSEEPESQSDSPKASSYGDLLDVKMDPDIPSQLKDYCSFRVSFNKENHTPNWSAWTLTAADLQENVGRYNKFWTDDDIIGCANTKDYTHSGYDRGHLCPAADNKLNAERMKSCFTMANICPQDGQLNSHAWKTLETKERKWAKNIGDLVIVAGPLYTSADKQRIGETGVRVPSAFFKVIIAPYRNEPMGIGFIYPNMYSPGDMYIYAMTIDEVEKQTGYDFFYYLPDEIEDNIEAQQPKQWRKHDQR